MTLQEIYRHPRSALRALRAWIMRRRVIPPPLPRLELPAPPLRVVRKSREERDALEEAANLAGSFYFREQILDDLDYYMTCIKRMRTADPDAYELYSRLGAHLLPWKGDNVINQLTPWWKANRPSFGAVAWTSDQLDQQNKKSKCLSPRFWYFQKFKYHQFLRNRLVQRPPEGSDIYGVTTYWDQPRDKKWKQALPTEFLIAITPAGEVFPLKEYRMRTVRATSKRKHWQPGQTRGRAGGGTITVPIWDVHEFYKDWAAEHSMTAEKFMSWLFFAAASMYEAGNRGMIRVEASKDNHAAVFGVDIKRTPYFFKDRGVTLNEHGHRRRIFHIVRPHTRVTEPTVPMHFRGERQFDWNGFDIRITVPGLHHIAMPEFTPGVETYDNVAQFPPGRFTQKQVGTWLHGGVASLDGVPNSMKNLPELPPLPRKTLPS